MIEHRGKIIYIFYGIICVAFIISYAISNIAIVGLLFLFFIDKIDSIKAKLSHIKNNKFIWLYFIYFTIQILGLIHSENKTEGLRRIEVLIPFLFLPAVVMAEQKNRLYFDKLLNILQVTIPSIFVVLIFVHVFIDQRILSTFVYFTVEEKLGVSQFYLVFILLIPLYISYSKIKKKKYNLINLLCFLISIIVIFILGNKTTIILLFLLAIIFLVKNYKNIKSLLLSTVVAAVFMITFVNIPIVKERFTTLFKTTDFDIETVITKNSFTVTKNTLEHRALINYLSFGKITEAMPFGVGTGDVQDILKKEYQLINFKAGILNNFNSHNQYFYEFFKTGILGGVLFILLIIFLNKKALNFNGLPVILTVFFTVGCFIECYLYRQHGVIIFTFLIPIFLTHNDEEAINRIF